jgi:polyisoprenoid-binding protein YceI
MMLTLQLVHGLMAHAQQQAWEPEKVDVSFSIRNAGSEVQGKFGQVSGQFVTDANTKLPVLIRGVAKANSINTGIGLRDRHLQSRAYLNVEKFPDLSFQMVQVTADQLTFYIRIKGEEQLIKAPYRWRSSAGSGFFELSFPLNRRDFGVGGSSLTLSDDLMVNVQLTLKKAGNSK